MDHIHRTKSHLVVAGKVRRLLVLGELGLEIVVEADGKRMLVVGHEPPQLLKPVVLACLNESRIRINFGINYVLFFLLTLGQLVARKALEVLEQIRTEGLLQAVAVVAEQALDSISA